MTGNNRTLYQAQGSRSLEDYSQRSNITEKSEDEYAEDDYKRISNNFKVINILFCALTVDIYQFTSHFD